MRLIAVVVLVAGLAGCSQVEGIGEIKQPEAIECVRVMTGAICMVEFADGTRCVQSSSSAIDCDFRREEGR